MLSIEFIRENIEAIKESCRQRGIELDFDDFIKIDDQRRAAIQKVEDLRRQRNELSQQKKPDSETIAKGQNLKEAIKKAETEFKQFEEKVVQFITQVPNILMPQVPAGTSEDDNVVLRNWGQSPQFDFEAKSYLELGEELNLIDIPRAARMAGSRFSYLKNELVLMQFALLNLVYETTQEFGFQPVIPPVMIKPKLMELLGYADLTESNIYFIEKDELNLVGTSEQSIAAMYQDEVLDEVPRRFVGYSTCFRREAGSYGRDLKGILRVHQFDKAELFSFCHPDDSSQEHELLIKIEERIMQSLELPYRVVLLCGGDLAKPSATTVDIESWLPSEGRYRETHSSSNCTDYQSQGLNIRYRTPGGKLDYVHTLNGTALAMSRILAVILENYQQADGTIAVPRILQKYLGFKQIPR